MEAIEFWTLIIGFDVSYDPGLCHRRENGYLISRKRPVVDRIASAFAEKNDSYKKDDLASMRQTSARTKA